MPLLARNDLITITSFGSPGEYSACENDVVHIFGEGSDLGFNVLFNAGPQKMRYFAFAVMGTVEHIVDWGRVRFECFTGRNDLAPSFFDEDALKGSAIDMGSYKFFVFKLPEDLPPQEKVQVVFVGTSLIDVFVKDLILK